MRRYDVALVGFGNVGRALARQFDERRAELAAQGDLELALTAIVDRGAMVHDPAGLPLGELVRFKEQYGGLAAWPGVQQAVRPDELRSRGVEALVLATPTALADGQPGLAIARAALDCGLDLVLADKGPLLHAMPELEETAARVRCSLGTSATTGCALPSLTPLRAWFGLARIEEIRGVLNGTSNLILTRLRQEGATYAEALAEAQREGIAEPDPTLDVEGIDTAIKLFLLARGLLDPSVAWSQVERRGITELPESLVASARSGPGRLRLVGRARRAGASVDLTVAPELVAPGDPLHSVEGAEKAVTFVTREFGELTLQGGASSRLATASALVRDLLAAARARR